MRATMFGAAIVAAIVLAGCAETPQRPPVEPEPATTSQEGLVLARDESFAIVVVGSGEDLSTLAQHYLGDRSKRWWISEFNNIDKVQPGQTVAGAELVRP